jgi:hypothetical protein
MDSGACPQIRMPLYIGTELTVKFSTRHSKGVRGESSRRTPTSRGRANALCIRMPRLRCNTSVDLLLVAHLLERSADRIALTAVIAIFVSLLILFIGAALAITLAATAKFRKQIFNRRVAGEGLLRLVG